MIKFSDILQAANLLKDRVIRTPLVYSPTFSRIAQAEVYLKLETRGFEHIKEIERAMEVGGYGYKRR